jgi:hypothetical protein
VRRRWQGPRFRHSREWRRGTWRVRGREISVRGHLKYMTISDGLGFSAAKEKNP